MAEQAINTIYLLGEQPDIICDQIIKRLAARVFEAPQQGNTIPNPSHPEDYESSAEEEPEEGMDIDADDAATATGATPKLKRHHDETKQANSDTSDMGDAFLLAQLVFVVGHVAIKHIVYLELIERELKRRKEVAAKGRVIVFIGRIGWLIYFSRARPQCQRPSTQRQW